MLLDFNSIKVRLELVRDSFSSGSTAFQFHKGAIRTEYSRLPLDRFNGFQFHKGAIRTRSATAPANTNFYFNSIKVRLEHYADCGMDSRNLNFNSIKVRLELNTAPSLLC